jgi:hypothetical protein
MTKQEVAAHCAVSNIECVDVGEEFELGAGMIFTWRGAPEHEEVHVKEAALAKMTPAQLTRVVTNGRDVTQVTRIVGYFSHVQNWNKSKIGELKDRHKGCYSVAGVKA